MLNARYSLIFSTIAALFASGCDHSIFQSGPKVVLPATPPLSAEVLEQTVGSCMKEVENLKSRAPYVPEERRKEYETVLALAEDNCTDMQETLSRLKRATHQEQSYRQNIEHVKATMLPGTVITESTTTSETTFDTQSRFGKDVTNEPLR